MGSLYIKFLYLFQFSRHMGTNIYIKIIVSISETKNNKFWLPVVQNSLKDFLFIQHSALLKYSLCQNYIK